MVHATSYQHGFDGGHEGCSNAQGLSHAGGGSPISAAPLGEYTIHHVLKIIRGLESCIGIWVQGIETVRVWIGENDSSVSRNLGTFITRRYSHVFWTSIDAKVMLDQTDDILQVIRCASDKRSSTITIHTLHTCISHNIVYV